MKSKRKIIVHGFEDYAVGLENFLDMVNNQCVAANTHINITINGVTKTLLEWKNCFTK